ncbi:hypothetical protein Patl1_20053 [Pistacia atlantica]|uniref:Uncharacterized protein n=1 Tax=Pistacia atlantica TaxID=434234 RepID=A0ACC1BNH0_9ROSI|nr:hypothetical protein Patl1_20053 [Pistacia atlantica]
MGEVVLSSEETMEMELETEKNETKKDGSSEVVRWERFLPRMVLRVLLVEANDYACHIIFAPLIEYSYKVKSNIKVPVGLLSRGKRLKGSNILPDGTYSSAACHDQCSPPMC